MTDCTLNLIFPFKKTEKASGKKSKAPVQLDIGNVLANFEKKQQSQKNRQDAKSVILSGGLWLLEYALFKM